jgi:hypothetical protein
VDKAKVAIEVMKLKISNYWDCSIPASDFVEGIDPVYTLGLCLVGCNLTLISGSHKYIQINAVSKYKFHICLHIEVLKNLNSNIANR